MANDTNDLNAYAEIQPIIQRVNTLGDWIVIVCPNAVSALTYSQLIAGTLPKDVQFSGRTGVFTNGGKVTIVSVDDDLIAGSFMVSYLGWGAKPQRRNGVSPWLATNFRLFRAENPA
jgi:hypothetical protein